MLQFIPLNLRMNLLAKVIELDAGKGVVFPKAIHVNVMCASKRKTNHMTLVMESLPFKNSRGFQVSQSYITDLVIY